MLPTSIPPARISRERRSLSPASACAVRASGSSCSNVPATQRRRRSSAPPGSRSPSSRGARRARARPSRQHQPPGFTRRSGLRQSPLALKATIAFEQAYNEIDGDSASSTELYALLSALSGLPLRQDLAVTGSVDQYGNVQSVGGITDKIEGFFAACKARGRTGEQGVMVPATNVRHLMLADEVVDAARRGAFHVWAVRSIDEGIELLTGRECAEVHRLVRDRLNGYAERLRAFVSVDGSRGELDRVGP